MVEETRAGPSSDTTTILRFDVRDFLASPERSSDPVPPTGGLGGETTPWRLKARVVAGGGGWLGCHLMRRLPSSPSQPIEEEVRADVAFAAILPSGGALVSRTFDHSFSRESATCGEMRMFALPNPGVGAAGLCGPDGTLSIEVRLRVHAKPSSSEEVVDPATPAKLSLLQEALLVRRLRDHRRAAWELRERVELSHRALDLDLDAPPKAKKAKPAEPIAASAVAAIRPDEVRPGDVLCGRSKAAFHNAGNLRFRSTISLFLDEYLSLTGKKQKTVLIVRVVEHFRVVLGARFLKPVRKKKKSNSGGRGDESEAGGTKNSSNSGGRGEEAIKLYEELSSDEVREKVGHALRDLAFTTNRVTMRDWKAKRKGNGGVSNGNKGSDGNGSDGSARSSNSNGRSKTKKALILEKAQAQQSGARAAIAQI